jgi:hypothetical protein
MTTVHVQTHNAYAYRRTGKKTGRARWCGTGWLETSKPPQDIADLLKVDVSVVKKILDLVDAHMFIEMVPRQMGTGYHFLRPKAVRPPHPVQEPPNPHDEENNPEAADEVEQAA